MALGKRRSPHARDEALERVVGHGQPSKTVVVQSVTKLQARLKWRKDRFLATTGNCQIDQIVTVVICSWNFPHQRHCIVLTSNGGVAIIPRFRDKAMSMKLFGLRGGHPHHRPTRVKDTEFQITTNNSRLEKAWALLHLTFPSTARQNASFQWVSFQSKVNAAVSQIAYGQFQKLQAVSSTHVRSWGWPEPPSRTSRRRFRLQLPGRRGNVPLARRSSLDHTSRATSPRSVAQPARCISCLE